MTDLLYLTRALIVAPFVMVCVWIDLWLKNKGWKKWHPDPPDEYGGPPCNPWTVGLSVLAYIVVAWWVIH